MRALSEEFLADLKEGVLFPLTGMVRSDSSLCLELRGDSINIYYRGGNLMKVSALKRPDAYSIEFDLKYFNDTNRIDLPDKRIKEELTRFSDEKPMLILALVNHDPEKSKLCKFLNKLPDSPHVELKIAKACFLGCGLYDQGIHPIDEARDRFRDYITVANSGEKAS